MRLQAKICGLSTIETLDAALGGGASHIGLVFYERSPRNVSIERAASLAHHARGKSRIVGLFVDPEPAFLESVRRSVPLDILQLQGGETPQFISKVRQGVEVWKAVPVRTQRDLAETGLFAGAADMLLYDAKPHDPAALPGGTGIRFDWSLLHGYRHAMPWGLAGGLTPDNLAEAVATTGATLVDVSSGVESAPGIKDVDKIAAFLKAARDL